MYKSIIVLFTTTFSFFYCPLNTLILASLCHKTKPSSVKRFKTSLIKLHPVNIKCKGNNLGHGNA